VNPILWILNKRINSKYY